MATELLVAGEWRQPSFLLHPPSQVLPFLPILGHGFDLFSILSLAVIASYHILSTLLLSLRCLLVWNLHWPVTTTVVPDGAVTAVTFASIVLPFACLGWVWTYWYHSGEQLLFFTGSCWSSREANSTVSRHSIFPRIKLVSKKSWCQYQTGGEKYVLKQNTFPGTPISWFPGVMSPSAYNTAYSVLHFWIHLWQSFLAVWLLFLPFNPRLSAQSCSSCPADLQWSKSSNHLAHLGSFASIILLRVQNVCFSKVCYFLLPVHKLNISLYSSIIQET